VEDTQPKFEGVEVTIAGKKYIMPPLTLKQVRVHDEDLKKLNSATVATDGDSLNAATRVIQAAMSRNYPDITTDQLEDMIDLGNIHELAQAILGVNQLKKAMALAATSL
jgi:poly-gamma-glutamate capsule biosynthesis protein CapA/YwtB (metallophosphatase superfamily)